MMRNYGRIRIGTLALTSNLHNNHRNGNDALSFPVVFLGYNDKMTTLMNMNNHFFFDLSKNPWKRHLNDWNPLGWSEDYLYPQFHCVPASRRAK
jgi:hypothetical protein